MTPYYETKLGELLQTDCRSIPFPDNHFTGVITDPPYELGFMGKKWDSSGVAFQVETWVEILRVCKPGAMLLAFGGTRTNHRLVCAIEDSGWEIRDSMMWMYGSGFPKSADISKMIDKDACREELIERLGTKPTKEEFDEAWDTFREKIPVGNPVKRMITGADQDKTGSWIKDNGRTYQPGSEVPATEAAKIWDGYGTSLKPAYEPIVIAMKPIDGTFANNALVHGVAGLNIDAGRVAAPDGVPQFIKRKEISDACYGDGLNGSNRTGEIDKTKGRWPANIILDEEAGAMLDAQSGVGKTNQSMRGIGFNNSTVFGNGDTGFDTLRGFNDTGGASRFFYTAKASRSERGKDNDHPTVKPVALIRYLVELTAPPKDALILDPFMGSGTLGVVCEKLGIKYVGIDLDCSIAARRIERETSQQRLPGGF